MCIVEYVGERLFEILVWVNIFICVGEDKDD